MQQLRGRLAHADDVRRQQLRQAKRARSPVKGSPALRLLAAKPGVEDWMEVRLGFLLTSQTQAGLLALSRVPQGTGVMGLEAPVQHGAN